MSGHQKTAVEMLAEATEGDGGKYQGPRLTFSMRCSAFAALYGGVSNRIVAKAFKISRVTVSKLNGCLEYDPEPQRIEQKFENDVATGHLYTPGPRDGSPEELGHNARRRVSRKHHYPDVWREFDALGPKQFTDRYYTPRIHSLIVLAKHELAAERRAK